MIADLQEMSEEAQLSYLEYKTQTKWMIRRGRITEKEAERRMTRQRGIIMVLKDLDTILSAPSDARRRVAAVQLLTRINPECTPQQVELLLDPIVTEPRRAYA